MQQTDDISRRFERALRDGNIEKQYGRHARAMANHLPALFRLLNRAAFDLSLPLAARQLAAQGVVYLAEPEDFLGLQHGKELLIDDTWVAYRVLERLSQLVNEDKLATHWRDEKDPLPDVVALANNTTALEGQVPSRVLTLLRAYLGEPAG